MSFRSRSSSSVVQAFEVFIFFRSQLSHKPYCGKITTHAISFSLRLQLRSPHSREAGSNGFHRTLEVRGNKYQRFTRINKFEQPSILLRCPFCSAVLHSHQERNSPVFVFGPGRERANLILSTRARLRIDERLRLDSSAIIEQLSPAAANVRS